MFVCFTHAHMQAGVVPIHPRLQLEASRKREAVMGEAKKTASETVELSSETLQTASDSLSSDSGTDNT